MLSEEPPRQERKTDDDDDNHKILDLTLFAIFNQLLIKILQMNNFHLYIDIICEYNNTL